MISPIDKKRQSLSTQTIYKQISFYQLIDMLIKLVNSDFSNTGKQICTKKCNTQQLCCNIKKYHQQLLLVTCNRSWSK